MNDVVVALKEIALDKDEVFRDPRAEGLEFLRSLSEGNGGDKEEAMEDLASYGPDKLYCFKDNLRELRRSVRGKRGPGPSHTRAYCTEMLKRTNAELKRRGLPRTRPGDARCYGPGCAPWQRAGREAA